MPGLHLYTSNRIEVLVDILTSILARDYDSDPFQQERIVIQNRGMERWLSLQLSKKLGIWTNFLFPFPNAIVNNVFQAIIPEFSDTVIHNPEILSWRIMELLPTFSNRVEFNQLRTYLSGNSEFKLYQLSKRIAEQFDSYTIYRPDIVLEWENGAQNHWQAILWRALFSDTAPHRAKLKQLFISKIHEDKNGDLSNKLPNRISVFGISSLPPFFTDIFASIASYIDINFFLFNPSSEFWDDILSEKEINKLLKKKRFLKKSSNNVETLHLETGNQLLSSLGAYGRDFLGALHNYDGEEEAVPVDPGQSNLLSSVQSDILTLESHTAETQNTLPTANDHSIQFHSCHNPLREIEVLYDNLLHFFEIIPDLKPSDIVVMTPNMETYAPFIEAVFGAPESSDKKIPFSLADRAVSSISRIVSALFSLIETPGARFSVKQIVTLLEVPEIQNAFDLNERDVLLIKNWIKAAGIRWGIDDDDKARLNLPEFKENTWTAGINRLILGFSLPSFDEFLFKGIAGFDHIEGGQSITLGKLLNFFREIKNLSQILSSKHSLSKWSEILLWTLGTFIKADEEKEQEISLIREQFTELDNFEKQSGNKQSFDLDIIKDLLKSAFSRQSSFPGFINGGVTFCAMLPMRSIPFRIVCLLGMNDDSFPRKTTRPSWDLISANPRKGDRSLEAEDRYLFLEALCCARDIFYISYLGQNSFNNSVRHPSVLVEELLEYIKTNFTVNPDFIHKKHFIQAFNPEYFRTNSTYFSYSGENFEAAKQLQSIASDDTPFFSAPLPETGSEFRTVQISDLINFFANPAKYLLQKRMGIILESDQEVFSDEEPFTFGGLDKYKISESLMEKRLQTKVHGSIYEMLKANGSLPHGTVGVCSYKDFQSEFDDFFTSVSLKKDDHQLPDLSISLDLSTFHLEGYLNNIQTKYQLIYRFADCKPKDILTFWIKHLALNASKPSGYPEETILITRDRTNRLPAIPDAAQILSSLLDIYRRGLSFPIPFFPKASWSYAEAILKKDADREKALSIALNNWIGNDYIQGDLSDPYINLCFRNKDGLDKEFENLAVKIYKPIFEMMKSEE